MSDISTDTTETLQTPTDSGTPVEDPEGLVESPAADTGTEGASRRTRARSPAARRLPSTGASSATPTPRPSAPALRSAGQPTPAEVL